MLLCWGDLTPTLFPADNRQSPNRPGKEKERKNKMGKRNPEK